MQHRSKDRAGKNKYLSDLLLYTLSGDKSVDHYFVELSYSVSSGESLDVVVRVPVRVVNKHRVRCRQVNSW